MIIEHMTLVDFISDPKHFVARERLLHMKATLDMKLAAAHCGVQLQVTEPEIDNLGHDFIASVAFDQVYLQNKATLSDANVERWEIHTRFLEASFKDRDLAPVINGKLVGGMEGAFGGFLLHEVSTEAAALGELKVSYWYFDIIFANAVRTGLWRSDTFSPQQAESLLLDIAKADRVGRVKIRKAFMLPIISPSAILNFRLHLPRESNWNSMGSVNDSWDQNSLVDLWRREISYWVPDMPE
jgi:hypothetical protein